MAQMERASHCEDQKECNEAARIPIKSKGKQKQHPMISDVLSDAVTEIDRYMCDPVFLYKGELRKKIVDLRNRMEAVGVELDIPLLRVLKPAAKQPMISNALSEALSKEIAYIDLLLNNPRSEQEGPLREKFVGLRNHMEALRVKLDTPLLRDLKLWEKWESPGNAG
jgi:hypothetical protein